MNASAQSATFSFDDGAGTANAGTYTPGSSFTFAINMAFTHGGSVANLDGLSYWFEQQSPSSPFNFSITNRNVSGSQFTFLQTPGIVYPQAMNPANASDLGGGTQSGTGVGDGTYLIANLTVSISPSAANGVYMIENTTTAGKISLITDTLGHTVAIPLAAYTITVVPEPSATWLLLFATPFAVGLGRRLAKPRN
jgi:hypothetical protein